MDIKIASVFVFILLLSFPVSAQTVCGIHNVVADKLKSTFDEEPSGRGLANNGGVLEIYTSPEGTWTITLTRPDGLSCLMSTGTIWEAFDRKVAEEES